MNLKKLIFTQVLAIFTLLASCELIAADSLWQLDQSVKEQNFIKAYAIAIQLKEEHEGEPRYDYLYGLSALQSGHFNEAVYALERVVANQPKLIRPRLELATAYLKLKNKKAAIREFQIVQGLKPPTPVKEKVDDYIIEIQKKGDGPRHAVINSLLSLSTGYSDNINFGYDGNSIDLPLFGNVLLDPSAVQQGSAFAEARTQLSYKKSYSSRFNQFTTAAITHREYFRNSDFNVSDLDLRTGFTVNKNRNQYQVVLRGRPILLGGEPYSNTLGLDLAIRNSPLPGTVLSTALSLENYDHKVDSLRDRKRLILSTKVDKKANVNLHQFGAYLGKEDPHDKQGEQYSRDLAGLSYRLVRSWDQKNKSFLKLNYQHSKHQAKYPIYSEKRQDDQIAVKLGHEIKVFKKADLILAIEHINNDSNLKLYDTTRNEFQMGVRYEW